MGVVSSTIEEDVLTLLEGMICRMYEKSYNDYILLMARGDVVPELKSIEKEPYVVDYQMDNYYDETREKFYVEYLNKRYSIDGYDYADADGFFNLNVELMIYSHIWESHYLLKLLAHISDLLCGKPYDWSLRIPFNANKSFLKDRIISPLTEIGDELGNYLKEVYSPNLRNGFAHSMYDIDCDRRVISLHNLRFDIEDSVQRNITFDEFQIKFLRSIHLSYNLAKLVSKTRGHIALECDGKAVTEPFELPNKRKLQIFVDNKAYKGKLYPKFRAVLIKETVKRFNVGDWVLFESLKTPIEVVEVFNTETEQFVRLKGATKKCISLMLTLSTKPDEIDDNCSDYKLIRLYLS